MFHDPVEEGLFKANIMAGFLAFDPFVAQDLFPFSEEFLVEQGLADEFSRFICRGGHG